MRMSKVEIANFRAIKSAEMSILPVTAIIGENNSGKSTFLRGVDLFFSSSPKVQKEDFHDHDVSEPIEITVEFDEICPDERDEFGSKVVHDKLRVTRRIPFGSNAEFLVEALVYPGFSAIRDATGKAEKKKLFNELADDYGMQKVAAADDVEATLLAWEAANPDLLESQRVANFFGAENVAVGKLKAKTEFVFVPAVKDARDELKDVRSSPVRSLLASIAKQAIENSEDYKGFIAEAEERLARLTSPENAPELAGISAGLTEILGRYYSGPKLDASWQGLSNLPITLPQPDVRVIDGKIQTDVEYVGHGMQRAIVFTLLEYMARQKFDARDGDGFGEAQSDIIIVIEEPELFQHPTKQRLFAQALSRIAEGFNPQTGIRVQVVYATHSPLLVSLPDAERVRAVRKSYEDDELRISVHATSLEKCASTTADLRGYQLNVGKYGAGLHVVTADIAEGFFASAAVLVEGVSDVALLEAYYRRLGRDPLSEGIAIKSVDGKKKLDKPFLIFQELGVPTFLIFDNDQSDGEVTSNPQKAKSEAAWNHYLQRLAGVAVEACVDWPDTNAHNFCAWDGSIDQYVRACAGEDPYEAALAQVAASFDLSSSEGVKSPTVATGMLHILMEGGVKFDRLDAIIHAIDALNLSTPPTS